MLTPQHRNFPKSLSWRGRFAVRSSKVAAHVEQHVLDKGRGIKRRRQLTTRARSNSGLPMTSVWWKLRRWTAPCPEMARCVFQKPAEFWLPELDSLLPISWPIKIELVSEANFIGTKWRWIFPPSSSCVGSSPVLNRTGTVWKHYSCVKTTSLAPQTFTVDEWRSKRDPTKTSPAIDHQSL